MTEAAYESDVYAWAQAQAAALRAQAWDQLDIDHLVEEIEDLGNEQRHAVESQLRILLAHLLKWVYQPQRRRRSWRVSIGNARAEIAQRLRTSPSLRGQVPALLGFAYPKARRLARDETDLPLATFPEACPWSPAQLLDDDFLPEV
jgi:Domain of unknown function DUF29